MTDMPDTVPPKETKKIWRTIHRIENLAAFGLLVLLALVPFIDFLVRQFFRNGIEGANTYTYHLVVLITFLGGMIASRHRQHLAIATILHSLKGKAQKAAHLVNAIVASAISMAFAWASLYWVVSQGMEAVIGVFPQWIILSVFPIGFFFMALRFVIQTELPFKGKWLASLGILLGTLLALEPLTSFITSMGWMSPESFDGIRTLWQGLAASWGWLGIILLIGAGLLGTPLFVVLGGIALVLFSGSGGTISVIPNEAYTLLTGNAMPAIPLFTLVGFILAESKAGTRLVELFQAWLGWLPGGLVIVAVALSAFFTTFTGASGVTILALGGILYTVLTKNGGFSPKYATGLLTAAGSIGLLLPPSLPIILYGSMARISVLDMFVAGLLPGLLMIIAMSTTGIFTAVTKKIPRVPFDFKKALKATAAAWSEITLPVLITVLYFSGFCSLNEAAAMGVIYVFITQVVIHRDINFKAFPQAVLKSVFIIGGILVIIAVARGLSYFIVDASIPTMLAEWVQVNVGSKELFLVFLILALLVVGMFMDIFSAILVVVPLIIPIGEAFGVHPAHLGIIFLVAMEIGFLTPPVGLNLYLSSYCFKQPIWNVTKNVVPFFIMQMGILLLVTFVPWFSTWWVPAPVDPAALAPLVTPNP